MSTELSHQDHFDQLVDTLAVSLSSSIDTITSILEEQTLQSIGLFVSNSIESLIRLDRWTWQVLSGDFRQWVDNQSYVNLFHARYSFNIKLISIKDAITSETKVRLLIPLNNDWIDGILNQINMNNDRFLKVASLWFDVLSYLVREQFDLVLLPLIIHINNRLSRDFVMTEQFKSYMQQLSQPTISQSILPKKLMFYLKTCSLSLNVYLWSKNQDFPFTAKEIVEFLGRDYAQMILVQSAHVNSWSSELLSCIARLTGLICSICWWGGQNPENIELIIPSTDTTTYAQILAFIHIVSHQPFHRYLLSSWHHDENILIDTTLILLIGVVETQNLGCFIRWKTNLTSTLLRIAQTAVYDRICICAYGLLALILSDTQLKELKIADNISQFFFNVLEQAWKHPTKKWKKIPISYLLKGLLSLSTNDTIQNATAHFQKITLLIELCDEYPIIYDIIWSLSYNPSIQEQLRSNRPFMAKLAKLEHETNESGITRSVNGILWVLNSVRDNTDISNSNKNTKFDIMISYPHKEKDICKQLYDELIRADYRVWIDFDQMHGNIMDAMAQAIEQSHVIVLCMSEQYQRSNYCRAEAQYAFKRKLKIIPILVQKYYKLDGWLLFLVGSLLYIDFIKYDFSQAMEMLYKELKLSRPQEKTLTIPDKSTSNHQDEQSPSSSSVPAQPTLLPENVRDWTSSHVHQWLINNHLTQMAHMLSDTDGQSLIHLSNFMVTGEPEKILSLLQQDSLRRTNETLSLVEVSRFRSLIETKGLTKSKPAQPVDHSTTTTNHHSRFCLIL